MVARDMVLPTAYKTPEDIEEKNHDSRKEQQGEMTYMTGSAVGHGGGSSCLQIHLDQSTRNVKCLAGRPCQSVLSRCQTVGRQWQPAKRNKAQLPVIYRNQASKPHCINWAEVCYLVIYIRSYTFNQPFSNIVKPYKYGICICMQTTDIHSMKFSQKRLCSIDSFYFHDFITNK